MRDAKSRLRDFRAQVQDLVDNLEEADLNEVVEVGTYLAAIATTANKALDGIKKELRTEASTELLEAPGSTTFDGSDIGGVTVTVPKPKMKWVKGVDPEVIKRALGDDFDLFFATDTKYKPRPNLGDMTLRLGDQKKRSILLASVNEVEDTPRVSFRKV